MGSPSTTKDSVSARALRASRRGQRSNGSQHDGSQSDISAIASAFSPRENSTAIVPGILDSANSGEGSTAIQQPFIKSAARPTPKTCTETREDCVDARGKGKPHRLLLGDSHNLEPDTVSSAEGSGLLPKSTGQKRRCQLIDDARDAPTEITPALIVGASKVGHRKHARGSAQTLKVARFATRTYIMTEHLQIPAQTFKLYALTTTTEATPAIVKAPLLSRDFQHLLSELRLSKNSLPLLYFDSDRDTAKIDKQVEAGLKRRQAEDDDHTPSPEEESKLLSSNGLNTNLKPLNDIKDIFSDLTRNALNRGLPEFLNALGSRNLKVSTLCSGTESPLLALQMIQGSLRSHGESRFRVEHQFSCEIEPFKQAYIQRNFQPSLLFRDVMDLKHEKAHTAFGAMEPVPSEADIMIAGSSCVDFSALNCKPKPLSRGGESHDTLMGVIDYAKTHHPSIVILENVYGFPWGEVEAMWHDAGYATKVALLDSKDFYMPQTRQRGYLIGLRRAVISERKVDLDADEAVQDWFDILTQLQRRASSPFTDFIFHEGDARLQKWSEEAAAHVASARNVSWDKCRVDNLNYRARNSLGFKKPFTDWENNGSCVVPDLCNQLWYKRQPERVWDTVDINHLRDINTWWWDFLYKYRCINLSQSCTRELDNAPWGIIRCITACALIYFTYRGGPFVGQEALSLQGIPIEKLILSRESNKQLIDLAGNAMTTTAVGASVLAALISCRKIFSRPTAEDARLSNSLTHLLGPSFFLDLDSNWLLTEADLTTDARPAMDISEIRTIANKSLRLCSCESSTTKFNQIFQQCSRCGHTSCTSCGIKPLHEYFRLSTEAIKGRKSSVDFEETIRKTLPPRLVISGLPEALLTAEKSFQPAFGTKYRDAIMSAAEAAYHFVNVRRGRDWSVLYESQCSRLVLTFQRQWDGHVSWSESSSSPGLGIMVQWNLYAKPSADLPANSPIRKDFSHPIARLSCSKSLLDGQWEIRAPAKQTFQLLVIGEGTEVPSWEKKQGLEHPRFKNRYVWPGLEIRSPPHSSQSRGIPDVILGQYDLLGQCGTACGALHVKRMTSNTRTEVPVFLFLDPAPLGNASNDCFVFARGHQRLEHNETRQVMAKLDPRWRPSSTAKESMVDCEVCHKWVSLDGVQLKEFAPRNELRVFRASAGNIKLLLDDRCDTSGIPVIWFQLPMSREAYQHSALDTQLRVDLVKNPFSLDVFAWLLKIAASDLDFEEWHEVTLPAEPVNRCLNCAPVVPSLVWQSVLVGKNFQIRPFENVEEACAYERKIRLAPGAATAYFRYDTASQRATVKVDFNILTLIHQAIAALSESPAGEASPSSIRWRAILHYDPGHSVPFPQLQIRDCQANTTAEQPPSFARSGQKLSEQQCRSLAWMKEQEDNPPSWFEQEVTEALVVPMSLRLEARATAYRRIRGGVLADDVGYGKTALVIALTDHHFKNGVPTATQFVDGEDDMIKLKATLILVPSGLTKQWRDEIVKFVGDTYKITILTKDNLFVMSSVATFQSADFILASWDLFDDNYIAELARMSKAPYTPPSAGRGFEEWFYMAQKDLKMLVKESHGLKRELFRDAWRRLKPRKYERFQELSRRNKGGIKPDAGDKHQHKIARNQVDHIDIQEPKRPFLPLHGCKFNRIVVDEFTYLGPKLAPLVSALQAHRRWILSGTPPHDTFQGVSSIARLLGTSVGLPDDAAVRHRKVREGGAKDISGGEALRSYATLRTPSWQKERFTVAQAFVSKFVRKNTAFVKGIRKHSQYNSVVLAASERALYFEAFLVLVNRSLWDGKKETKKKLGQTRTDWLANHIAASQFPEEALITLCSTMPDFARDRPLLYECRGAIEEKMLLIRKKLEDMLSELQGAFWLDATYHDEITSAPDIHQYLRSVEKNCFGDSVTRELMSHVIALSKEEHKWTVAKAANNNKPSARASQEKKEQYSMRICQTDEPRSLTEDSRVEDLKMRAKSLIQWTLDLVNLVRERRFLNGADSCASGREIECSLCGHQTKVYGTMFLLGRCGHITCQQCHQDQGGTRGSLKPCPDPSCEAGSLPESTIEAADLTDTLAPGLARKNGSKMAAIVQLLRRIPRKEKVLIFVQFERIAKAMRVILQYCKIKFADMTYGRGLELARIVDEFKRDPAYQVCILQLDSSNAAGWNLQAANHVIFVSPLVARTQHEYRSSTTQALGRVFRLGQEKDVHVYNFLADKTIEVTILEERTGKTLVERKGRRLLVDKDGIQEGDTSGFGGLRFRGAACAAGGNFGGGEDDAGEGGYEDVCAVEG